MTIGKGKRPRDPNQLAKWIADHSTRAAPVPEGVQSAAILTGSGRGEIASGTYRPCAYRAGNLT